ncbi:MAG TPA: aminotransferase class III-fold pyridoxal phosphate-dependent enzyme [Candidatus Saccharimonadales bacterium]|nr:aminotransferase class III-fold pyridoxal phosphate-dependent enzyme [Candidatus Saccharimonadales bacterium]
MTEPTDRELRDLSSQVLVDFMPMASFSADPFVLVEGDGIRVRDSHGRWYIDGMSGVFVSSFGHRNQRLAEAAAGQALRLAFHLPLHSTNLPTLRLVDRLLEITAGDYAIAKLTASGSEATEAAIKMARQYQAQSGHGRRYKILSHYRGYHGSTGHALAASGSPGWRSAFEPFAAGFVHVHAPFALARRIGSALADPRSVADAAIALIEETIELEDPETIAAFVTEPIILSAGVRVPPADYLPRLHALLRNHGILLIHDEIITGFGRTGRLFAGEHFGVVPDILCFGKSISGGYAALAGLMVQKPVADAFWSTTAEGREFRDGHTYGNNPIAAAVGLAALELLEEGRLVARSAELGTRITARLQAAALPAITDVRGHGLLIGIELAGADATGAAVAREARQRGLIVRTGIGFVALGPPLTTTDAEADEIVDILVASVRAATSEETATD